MRKFSFLPSLVTAFGLACGLYVIFKTVLVPPSTPIFELLEASCTLILIAALADMFDGAIARLFKLESEFGGQFDSLSDTTTFVLAPPILVLKALVGNGWGQLPTLFLILACMVYALCGVLRLVRFNVHSLRERKKEAHLPKKRYFKGLPVPAAAALVLSANLLFVAPILNGALLFPAATRAWVLAVVMLGTGYFMVSRIRFPSVKALYFKVNTFYLVLFTVLVVVLVLYGILECFSIAFFVGAWGYLLISVGHMLARLFFKKQLFEEEDPSSSIEDRH